MNAFVNPNQEAENEAVTEPSSMKFDQKTNAKQQHEKRNDELQVRKDRFGGSDETHFAFPNGSGMGCECPLMISWASRALRCAPLSS